MTPYRKPELPKRTQPINRFWTGRILAKVRPKIIAKTIPSAKSPFRLNLRHLLRWLIKDDLLMAKCIFPTPKKEAEPPQKRDWRIQLLVILAPNLIFIALAFLVQSVMSCNDTSQKAIPAPIATSCRCYKP